MSNHNHNIGGVRIQTTMMRLKFGRKMKIFKILTGKARPTLFRPHYKSGFFAKIDMDRRAMWPFSSFYL